MGGLTRVFRFSSSIEKRTVDIKSFKHIFSPEFIIKDCIPRNGKG